MLASAKVVGVWSDLKDSVFKVVGNQSVSLSHLYRFLDSLWVLPLLLLPILLNLTFLELNSKEQPDLFLDDESARDSMESLASG